MPNEAALTPAQKAWVTRRANSGKPAISDFGAKIGGAKKDRGLRRLLAGPAAPRKPRVAKPLQFTLFGLRTGGLYWFEKKGDRANRRLKTFPTLAEAREFRNAPDFVAVLTAAWNAARDAENVTDDKIRSKANLPRVGPDYRNGENVTPQRFLEVFKPHGVEFGLWQTDRAECLNQAHDALRDLAGFLGMEPDALTLGGKLSFAFGARGHGKAAAHYECGYRVINLTKTAGAGCLAHEWFHAFDHALTLEAGRTGLCGNARLHETLRALPVALRQRSVAADRTRSGRYYSKPEEMLARAFEGWVRATVNNDYLANIVKMEGFGPGSQRYPYPTPEELPQVDAAFRRLFGLDNNGGADAQ